MTRATRPVAILLAMLPLLAAVPGRSAAEDAAAPAGDNAAGAVTRWDPDTVVAIALSRHPLVGQADAETSAAAARRGQSRSRYFPTVDLSAGYDRSRSFSSSSGRSATSESEYAQGTLTQVIADFGRRGAGFERADALLAASRESGRSVRQEVAFSVKLAYYDVLRARRILQVAQDTLAQRESLLRQADAYHQAGIRARIDVARAEANLYQARAELTAAENDLRVARITLLNRMGVDGPPDYDLADTLAAEIPPGTVDEWVREAEGTRPELQALLSRERAAEAALNAARAGHNPVISGNGGYGYEADDPPLQQTYTLSVQLTVPVFAGFLVREQVREAEASLASARYAVTDLRRIVRLEVERAALSLREASERIDARRKERDASAENLRLARGRYEVGAGDIIEMIDAQLLIARSEATMIQALYDSSIALASLHRSLGRQP